MWFDWSTSNQKKISNEERELHGSVNVCLAVFKYEYSFYGYTFIQWMFPTRISKNLAQLTVFNNSNF